MKQKETWKPFLQQQQQVMIKSGIFYPVKTIVAKDLDVGATFNADITSTPVGLVPGGRFMTYNAISKVMSPFDGTVANVAQIFGILVQDTDTTQVAGANAVGMVYRRGTFLRQEIEEANRVGGLVGGIGGIPGGDANFLEALRIKGIFLEWSWEGYGLIEAPPTPVPPIP